MKYKSLLVVSLLLLLLFSLPALASGVPGGGDIGVPSSSGTILPFTPATIVNVTDSHGGVAGASCNGTTDDAPAWNAALAYIKSISVPSGGERNAVLVGCRGNSLVQEPLNFTGFPAFINVTFDGNGGTIIGQTSGLPVIDALGSRWIYWDRPNIVGLCTNPPNIGIQIGRISTAAADDHVFNYPQVTGCFTLAALYNFASESVKYTAPYFSNAYSVAPAYVVVLDGVNHQNAQSTFVTQTLALDTQQSFLQNTFDTAKIQTLPGSAAGSVPLWISGASKLRFYNGYVSNSVGTYGADLFTDSGLAGLTDFYADIHFETVANLTDTFFITGTNVAPVFNGFYYHDNIMNSSNSVFKVDSALSSPAPIIRNLDLQLPSYAGGNAHVFDNASLWTITGQYASQVVTQWNAPASAQMTMLIGQQRTLGNYGTGYFSLQFPDSTTTGGNNRGANSVDLQTLRTVNNQIAGGMGSTLLAGSGSAASGNYGVAGQNGNFASGANSVALNIGGLAGGNASWTEGINGTDRSHYNAKCRGAGEFSIIGDREFCDYILIGQATTASAIRLTADGNAASTNNCINLPAVGLVYSLTIDIEVTDHTTPTNSVTWNEWQGKISRPTNAASTHITMGTTPTAFADGTMTTATVSATADTTNACLNLSVTPPTGNTDTLNIVAHVHTVATQ